MSSDFAVVTPRERSLVPADVPENVLSLEVRYAEIDVHSCMSRIACLESLQSWVTLRPSEKSL